MVPILASSTFSISGGFFSSFTSSSFTILGGVNLQSPLSEVPEVLGRRWRRRFVLFLLFYILQGYVLDFDICLLFFGNLSQDTPTNTAKPRAS
jgi:hypothetical protein